MQLFIFTNGKGRKMAFTHLHTHTEYSLLDGSSKIKELVRRAKDLGMDSLAITDHGVMYGVIDFYRAAKEVGIKPILGCEVYVAPGSRFDRENRENSGDRYYHLILLAENNTGYANLMKIVSKGFVEGFYYKPRIDIELLREYHEGIIALSACLAGEIPKLLARGLYDEAKKKALEYRDIFGEGNFFLELQDHGIFEQKIVNQQLVRLSKETGIDLVVTNDVHYINKEDWEAHDILLCIQTAKKVMDEDRMRYKEGEFYLRSEEEMKEIFPYAPEAIENTQKIANRCNVEIEFGVTKLPEYPVPENETAVSYLSKLCEEGLKRRYHDANDEIWERMRYELGIIEKMGYVDYFLIVWDYIHYAKSHGIAVGPGRGSAAGSIVSYCLGITDIDPLKYQLLFERFLNPERVSMPDIDVDFCYERRQEVINYVVEKYGKDRVCQIVTFGTMAAKGVLRDVGRALDIPYAKCDQIAKLVPKELGITLDLSLKLSKEFREVYESDPEIKNLVDMSRKLEGLPRHSSMHAAGVVISKKEVDEYVPLSRASDGSITTQFTMTTLEELGLLKMDFLGLRTLTVIQNTVDQIERNYGKKLDMLAIDYNDKKVYDAICTGKTEGVFQIESSGMQSFMKELRPESLEDVIAGISLYRPGPMDFIPKYIKGKDHRGEIVYDCPQLESILSPTYGCIVYQEQVMQIVRDLAGYTLGRSDMVRRAMSKKKASVMEKERKNFVYGNEEEGVRGCIANGIKEEVANRIFDEMIDFAKYAFNKSHAACYAYISYQTAYLKYYYPKEFMASLLTSVMDNTTKVSEYILSCRQMGIAILPPDINEGESKFSVAEGGIRFGLSAIKGVGISVSDEIVRIRKEGGKFHSLEDLVERTSNKEVNRRTLENFIKSGALDSLEGNRNQKLQIVSQVLNNKSKNQKNVISGQMSLFDFATEEDKKSFQVQMPEVKELSREQILLFEKETLGIYISGHPLEDYADEMEKNVTAKTSDFAIDEESNEAKLGDGQKVIIGGMITSMKKMTTKKMQMMAFVELEDMVGSVEVIVFPKIYEQTKKYLNEEARVYVEGRVQIQEDGVGQLIGEKILPFDQTGKELWLQYADKEDFAAREKEMMEILQQAQSGIDGVYIYLKKEHAKKFLGERYLIALTDGLKSRFEEILGQENVKIVTKRLKTL